MDRINEFEKMLTDKVSQIENQDVTIEQFDRFLSGDGEIHYSYSIDWNNYEIKAVYIGSRYYREGKINLKLTIEYDL